MLSKYKLSSFVLNRIMKQDFQAGDIVMINSPSFLQHLDIDCKIIAVQHLPIDVLISNKSNFGRNKQLIDNFNNRVSAFVVLSEKDKIEAINILKFPEEKIHVIPHACRFEISHKNVVGFDKNLAMICRLDNEQKRIDLAINAMRHLPEWTLNIYGCGSSKTELLNLVQKLELKNVILHKSTSDVQGVLSNSDIHVMTSDYEGFGFTNIEAMSQGLPIIVRDTFPAASGFIDGNGILLNKEWDELEFVKAITYIENNYEQMSELSTSKARSFSIESVTHKWKQLIKSLK